MRFDAAEIVKATRGRILRDAQHGPIVTDSRAMVPGAWFLALSGERFDGHAFLGEVGGKGAIGCIVSKLPPDDWPAGAVLVDDTTRALQDLGRAARERFTGPVVGVTGSSGKTTTRSLIALAISGLGPIHQSEGNLNNHLGVPMTLVAAPGDAAAIVVEMGTSSPGEIALLAGIARPTVRLIVNVGPAHLEELGGLSGVAREKGALFGTARAGDTLCINVDDPHVKKLERPAHTHAVTYGESKKALVRLIDARVEADTLSTHAIFATPNGDVPLRLPVPGRHLAHNAAGALAVAYALGLDLQKAAENLERYKPVGMRMRAETLPGGVLAINDAYNANPLSMERSLEVLAELKGGRRVAVLGDMLELGEDEAEWHARVARKAGALRLDLVVLTGKRMSAAVKACKGAGAVWTEPDTDAVAARLAPWLRAHDRVLFKGSRGAKMERILQALRGETPSEAH